MNRAEIITCKKCGMPLKKGTKICSYCRQDTGYLINRAPKEHKYIRIWNWRIPIPWVTLILILLNAVAGRYKVAGGEYDVIRHLGMTQGALQRGEVLRFVLSNFLHMGLPHFISNMYGLTIYGFIFENRIGRGRYALIYLMGILGAGLLITFAGAVALVYLVPVSLVIVPGGYVYLMTKSVEKALRKYIRTLPDAADHEGMWYMEEE